MPPSVETIDDPRAAQPALSNSAAAVLGMLVLGARSGYEVRRAAELSFRFFWALGPPQIYAELSRLEMAGLIRGHDDNRGRRPRRSCRATPRGRAALTEWATSDRPAPLELRDALLLRLFFADVADPAEVTTLLHRLRDRSCQALAAFQEQIAPAAIRAEARGFGQPGLVAEFGAALHRFIVDWCEERLGDG